jgi:hypothetical protein
MFAHRRRPNALRGRWQFSETSPPAPSGPATENVPIIDLEECFHRAI